MSTNSTNDLSAGPDGESVPDEFETVDELSVDDNLNVEPIPQEDSPGWQEIDTEPPVPDEIDWNSKRVVVGRITQIGSVVAEVNGESHELPWWDLDVGTGFVRISAMNGPFDFLIERKPGDNVMIRFLNSEVDVDGNRTLKFQTFVHP